MTFTYDGADLGSVIKKYLKDGYNYEIEYLDGSISNYYCSSKFEEDRLEDLMLEQAIERENKMQILEIKISKELFRVISYVSSLVLVLSLEEQKKMISFIMFLVCILSIKDFRKKRLMLNELKKYQLYIDVVDRIKEVNQSKLLKCVEFDNIYQIPLNINNLDCYTLNEMKKIRKKLFELEKNKSK